MTKPEPDYWAGCYDQGWQKIIHPAAFGHPAKYARGLISRIVKHALDEGMIQPGSTVLDPFGGVSLGAWAALQHGLNYIGVELEYHFHHLGQGWDCPGFDQATWRRYHGRAQRVYKGKSEWLFCPDCAEMIDRIPVAVASMFGNSNGRMIPTGPAHRFAGNIERWQKMYQHLTGSATLLQGDSRRLGEVIKAAGVIVSSPPYAESLKPETEEQTQRKQERIARSKTLYDGRNLETSSPGKAALGGGYGSTPGQLATLPPGTPPTLPAMDASAVVNSPAYPIPSAVISSPPFAGNTGGRGEASRNGIDSALFDRHSGGMKKGTGSDPANLDHLKTGTPPVAIVSSPPYAGAHITNIATGRIGDNPESPWKQTNGDEYGSTPGQLGAMASTGHFVKPGEVSAVVGSPPFENSLNNKPSDQVLNGSGGRMGASCKSDEFYGSTAGQIGATQGQTFWEAAALIVSQCYDILPPNGVAIWVVKNYVKAGREVDFTGQWQALCEACGFETVHIHRAMLVKHQGVQQGAMEGAAVSKEVSHKSFFRRLSERRGSPPIDFESVLCTRKAA